MQQDPSITCLVCQKHRGEIIIPGGFIHLDDLIFISHAPLWGGEMEHYLGHIFIETKRHVYEIGDLSQDEAARIGIHTTRVAQALLAILPMCHVYTFVIGDGAPHFHVHIIGRYNNAPREYWGPRVDEWPQAPKGKNEDIAKLSAKIKKYYQEKNW